MEAVTIKISALWVAVMLSSLMGDVLHFIRTPQNTW